MQMISKSVGAGGANEKQDATLIQVMLMKVKRFTSVGVTSNGYLSSYDGDCGNKTIAAIKAFQDDQVWNPAAPKPPAAPPLFSPMSFAAKTATAVAAAPVPFVKPGLIEPDDATWKALVAQTPPEFQDLRALPGGKIAYIAGTENQRQASVTAALAETFVEEFRQKVILCINAMHKNHGIVISVCAAGARRDFATQDGLLNNGQNVTHAGPGESNHNFGMAVDMGFKGLRWIHPHGAIEENEDSWMHKLDPGQVVNQHALKFWQAMRDVGTSPAVGLFRGPEKDRPHLQNWNDAGVDMGVRLADLLTRAGTMKWSVHYSGHYKYRTDLGWGGGVVEAGTASEIWNGNSTITLEAMKAARQTAPPNPALAGPPAPLTATDVIAMKKTLQDQFKLADAAWRTWTPH